MDLAVLAHPMQHCLVQALPNSICVVVANSPCQSRIRVPVAKYGSGMPVFSRTISQEYSMVIKSRPVRGEVPLLSLLL